MLLTRSSKQNAIMVTSINNQLGLNNGASLGCSLNERKGLKLWPELDHRVKSSPITIWFLANICDVMMTYGNEIITLRGIYCQLEMVAQYNYNLCLNFQTMDDIAIVIILFCPAQ